MPRAAQSLEEVQEVRNRICAVATRLFSEGGYEGVTLRAIAAELGCSPMTPYRYFTDKAEIFAAVKASAFERFADALERRAAGIDDLAERLAALGRAYIDFALTERDDYRVMFEMAAADSSLDDPKLMESSARAWAAIHDQIALAIDSGVLIGDPATVAHVFWAGVHGLVSLELADKLQLGVEVDALMDPLLTSLLLGNHAGGGSVTLAKPS